MRFKYLLPIVMALSAVAASVSGAVNDGEHNAELNRDDLEMLRTYLREKREQDTEEDKTDVIISGDIRTEYRYINEKELGHRLRSGRDCADRRISKNDFDIEANLWFNSTYDRVWAVANLQFDNSAGVSDNDCFCEFEDEETEQLHRKKTHRFHGSGNCDSICLKRAYFGYNVYKGCGNLDIEIGRRKLYDVFESEIEFDSRMDGIVTRYSKTWENMVDWYWTWAAFVVDERVNHFAWATEMGFMNIADIGLDFKYSFIDWEKRGKDRCNEENPKGFKYWISQAILTYHLNPELLCRPAEVYGAVLVNHNGRHVRGISGSIDPEDNEIHEKKQFRGWAWYVGFTVGKVKKAGDWSVDIEYQWVQKYAIPYDDINGIGLGNLLDDCCTRERFGPTIGYKGYRIDLLYAVTDAISLNPMFEASRSNQGRSHTFSTFKLQAIYSF